MDNNILNNLVLYKGKRFSDLIDTNKISYASQQSPYQVSTILSYVFGTKDNGYSTSLDMLTGGLGNVMTIDKASWEWPELFKLLQREGGVEQFEMYRTFNCGVGMVIAVDANDADKTVQVLNAQGEKAWKIGHIQENAESVEGADEKIRVIFA